MEERPEICVARQPICDSNGRVTAFELLCRATFRSAAAVQDRDLATSDVLVTAFLELGLDQLLRGHTAHVNLSPAFLEGRLGMPAGPDQIVLELPADAAATDARLDGAAALAAAGYRLVLDDFEYRLELEPLLACAYALKLDMTTANQALRREYAAVAHASDLPIIAKGVEDYSLLRQAIDLRCSGFQGYYFAAPELISGRAVTGNHAVLLNLLARLQDPELAVDELERLVAQDATLAYRLLRLANSAAMTPARRVETVRDAVLLLGARLVRQWTTLLVLARFGESHPEPLLDCALLRGRMCEVLATAEGTATADAGFTMGLFSTLDALLGVPLTELLDQICLDDAVRIALTAGRGPLGDTLRRAVAFERGHWAAIPAPDLATLKPAYEEAVRWCDETRAQLSAL